MANEPSILDVADEEFAQINKPEQKQEQGSILDIADDEFKKQEEESTQKEFDVAKLEKLKAEGKPLSEVQQRMIFDEQDKVPLLEQAGKGIVKFLPAAGVKVGELARGAYELAREGAVKPVYVGAKYNLGLATPKETNVAARGAEIAYRSAVSGVMSDLEDTAGTIIKGYESGSAFTDKLQGLSADERFKRYRFRERFQGYQQARRDENPDRAAAILAENVLLQKAAGIAAKMQGGTEEEAKEAEKAYSELVLESGLTREELNPYISSLGEVISPISIPGANIATKTIGKYTGKAVQKGGELALKGVVKPIATGVEKVAELTEKGITGVQTGARKLGEYVTGDPDTLIRGGSIAGLISAPQITGTILAAKPAAIATKEIARTFKDIASAVDVGGAAGRRGLVERGGAKPNAGALTKRLFSAESRGGLGRARAADWMIRQGNAITQQGVNGAVLNTILGLPDIESIEQGFEAAGSGFGIGAFTGSRIMERAGAAIDPRTGLAQKIDTIITPDPSSRRADEDADIKRFLSSVDPDLVPKMEKLGSIDERKKAIQSKVDALEKQKNVTFGPEVELIKKEIIRQKRNIEKLDKSTPQTQKEILRQIHLAFADEMDLAKTTGKAAGLNNIQVKILDPSEMEGFFRNSYGATLTDAESVIASLTGKPDLSPQESENLINSRRIVDGFYNEIGSAQSARGLAISEGSDLEGNEVPAFMRKKNLQGATIVINGDLVKQLSNEGFNIRNVVGHEMQHALGRFTEVRDMLAPLRRELFDQNIVNEDGTVNKVTQGIYSDDKLDAYADTYAASMSPSDNGESFKAQFGGDQNKLRAYIKEEILSEIAGRSGNVSGGTRAGLDSIGRQVVDWIEVNTQNGALKKIKETLRKGGIIVDDSGDISTVLGAELTPESLAMIRQYQRQLKNLNQSMVYEEDARKEEVEIPITKILSDRTLQEKFKNSDIFEKEQVATMTAPDGSKQEIPIPPNAGVDPFVGTYRIQGGQLVDESGNPMNLGPNITFGTMPDGTQVEVGTRIARNVDGSPKILSNREIEARSRNRGKVIRNAIDSALSKGALQLEDTGNGNYRGVMSEAQVNAVLALPNTIVSPNLKRQILFVNEILRRKDGTRMYMEYQAAMRGGKSRALAPQIRDEIPIGFQFSKQGNFLITTMSVSRMHNKMNAWVAKKPENLKLWNGDTASFWDDVIKVLDNHSKGERGETGLDPDAAIALEKKNAVNDLFNVWNADTKAANPRRTKLPVQKGKDPIDVIVRARRIDRINQYNESSLKKMPFNYELNTRNYMPAENPLADFQTPEDFANELPSVTAEEIRNAINTGNLDQLESRLREGDDLKPAESLDEKDGNIRIVSMFDNEFMPEESLDFVDVKPTENDKRTNVGISFMPASEEDYAYRGQHKAPDQESGSPLHKVTESIYPDDFYALPFEKTLQYYGSGEPRSDSESLSAILSAKDKPNAKVKVYRAVPKYTVQIDPVKAKEIEDRISKFEKLARLNPWSEDFKKQLDDALAERPQVISDINAGDWVTPSRSYAADHGESALNGQYRILSKSVPASHLFTEGNSLSEFGYNPPSAKGIQFMPAETERYPTSERGMYSGLQKTIDEKVQGKFASPDQLKAIVTNPQNAKAEELKWSGVLGEIDRLAAENNGKVPKDAVMEYLRNYGAIKFEEVTLGGTSTFLVTDVNGEVMGSGGTESDAIADAANALSMDFLDVEDIIEKSKSGYQGEEETLFLKEDEGESDSTKYAQYQLPGGTNYREVVMTMPDPKLVRYNELNKIGATYMTDEQFAEYKQLEKSGLYKNQYTSSHFPETPNYVAHMRLNERTIQGTGYAVRNTESGRKGPVKATSAEAEADLKQYPSSYSLEIVEVPRNEEGLFIEELQSDRHQAGREKGYGESGVSFKVVAQGELLGEYQDKRSAEQAAEDFREEGYSPIGIEEVKGNGIPDAPFRKDWSIQLFKRALRDAVDADKKWIGWTTGDTQAERYKLSKQVDSIVVILDGENTYALTAYKDGRSQVNKEKVPEAKLSEFIGKELANQAIGKIKSSEQPSLASAEFEGLDLDVGGEGMKGFYDQILPKEIGKYVGKMGGKVEKSEIGQEITEDDLDMGDLSDATPQELAELEATGKVVGNTVPIWRVNITPEMAGKVRGGQLQFMPADSDYLNLAKDPEKNREQLQGMVDVAAKKAGYTTKGFHRTPKAFNEFILGGPDAEAKFWITKSGEFRTLFGQSGRAIWFGSSPENLPSYHNDPSGNGILLNVYLKNPSPLQIDDDTRNWARDVYADESKQFPLLLSDEHIKSIRNDGYTGIEYWKNGKTAESSAPDEMVVFDPTQIKSADPITYDDNGNAVPLSQRFNPKTSDIRFMPEQPTEYEPISARIRPLEGISAPTKQVGAKALSLGEIEPPVRGKAMLPDMELKPDISEKGIQSSDITTSAKPAPDAVIKPFSNALVSSAGLINFLPAFHGTPFDVDKFKLEKIGTGEGAQAYGWGLYFAQARKVAQDYKDKLTDWNSPGTYEWKGMSLRSDDYKNPIRHAISLVYHQGINQAKQIGKTLQKDSEKGEPYTVEQGGLEYAKKFNDALSQVKSKKEIKFEQGNLYKVDLDVKDEDLLDWDKPLSEQSEKIRNIIKQYHGVKDLGALENRSGSAIYIDFGLPSKGNAESIQKQASSKLLELGIPGIRYLDGTSRNKGDGTYNYVIFDENLITILDKNDKPVQGELPRATGLQFMPAEGAKKPKTAKKEPKKKKEAEKQYITIDSGDDETVPVLQEIRNGKPLTDPKGDPKFVQQKYELLASPFIDNYSGNNPEDTTKPNYDELAYDVSGVAQKKINAAIDSGAVDAAANIMVSKTNEAMKNADISAGSGWYSRMRENLLNALGVEGRELLSQLLGATSAKTPVNENFLQAMDGYEGMKSGRYDSNRKAYLEMINAENKNELNDLIDDRNYIAVIKNKISDLNKAAKKATGKKQKVIQSEAKKLKELIAVKPEDRTKKNRFSIVINASGLMPLRSNGKKFNANSMAVMKVIAGTWLDNRKAPKTPNFAGNLSGRTVQATIDVWAARFMRQILHEGSGTPWRIQPKSETGVTNEDFALGQVVMQRAAKKLGMNPDDLQAILWFAEKHNWDDRGWTGTEGAEKSSFDEIFSVFFPKGKKPLTFSEASEVLKSQKNKDESIDEQIDEETDEDTDEE